MDIIQVLIVVYLNPCQWEVSLRYQVSLFIFFKEFKEIFEFLLNKFVYRYECYKLIVVRWISKPKSNGRLTTTLNISSQSNASASVAYDAFAVKPKLIINDAVKLATSPTFVSAGRWSLIWISIYANGCNASLISIINIRVKHAYNGIASNSDDR